MDFTTVHPGQLSIIASDFDARPMSFVQDGDRLGYEPAVARAIGELLDACRFITMARPGTPPRAELAARLPLPAPWPERLTQWMFEGHLIGISSSEIRKRVAESRPIRYLVPRTVEDYITQHRLYRR